MFGLNKIFVVTFISMAALVICKDHPLNGSSAEKNAVPRNATLFQLKARQSGSNDALYTYKCYAGEFSPQYRLTCTSSDSTSWPYRHDVEVKLRCPEFGFTSTLTFVDITFTASSDLVNCFVHEGGVGLNAIGFTLQAAQTLVFDYRADFYGLY